MNDQEAMKIEAAEAEAEAIATIKADMARRKIAAAIPRMRITRKSALKLGVNRLATVASLAAHDRERPANGDA